MVSGSQHDRQQTVKGNDLVVRLAGLPGTAVVGMK